MTWPMFVSYRLGLMGVDGDLNEFDNRLKYSKNLVGSDPYGHDSDSSDDEI